MSLFEELKRRNVFKVAVAYIIVAWLLLQVSDTLVPALHLPEWFNSGVAFVLIIGFPIAMIFAWAFEMTPEGLKKEKDVDRSQSIVTNTGKKLNNTILVLLALAVVYLLFDKFSSPAQMESDPFSQQTPEQTTQTREKRALTPVETTEATPTISQQSIAVLPFVNMSSDREQEYFSDGLSEELLNLLAKIPELRVAARTSSFSFKGQSIEIPEIASRLNVVHVLEGSVRKSGNQIRITAQLIQADNGYHLWSETYDRQLDNIFQIQDEIANSVVDALKVTLLGTAPKARKANTEAYQLFLEGQYFRYQLTEESLQKAIKLFKSAVDIDPDYSPAWAELAYAYIWYAGVVSTASIEEANTLADHAIKMALSTDPNLAWAYFVRGTSRVFNKFDFKAGVEDYRHALQLDPGNASLIAATGTGARVMGRLDESIRQYNAALELDPVMPEVLNFLGRAHWYSDHLNKAETTCRKTLDLSPKIAGGHYRLGLVLLSKGDLAAALAELEQETHFVYRNTGLAIVHHYLDNNQESQLALDELIEGAADGAAYQIAQVYGFRNEPDKAFEWLEESLVIRDSGLASLLGDPALRSLIADPRWQPLLEKLGLLEFWLEMPPEYGGPIQ